LASTFTYLFIDFAIIFCFTALGIFQMWTVKVASFWGHSVHFTIVNFDKHNVNVTVDRNGDNITMLAEPALRTCGDVFLFWRKIRHTTTLPPTGELRSFWRARSLVRLELVAKLTATSITDQRVFADVLTQSWVESTFVVIWLHSQSVSTATLFNYSSAFTKLLLLPATTQTRLGLCVCLRLFVSK